MAPLPDGGLLDRLVEESIHRVMRDALEALHWFELTVAEGGSRRGYTVHAQFLPEPMPKSKPIAPNTGVLDMETIDDEDYECGNAVAISRTYLGYVDFYAENRSVGGEFAGDVSAILRGDHPTVGRSKPTIDIMDWSSATPEKLGIAEIPPRSVRTERARSTTTSWDGLIYSVQFSAEVAND